MKYLDKYKREPILYNILLDIEILGGYKKWKVLKVYIIKGKKILKTSY